MRRTGNRDKLNYHLQLCLPNEFDGPQSSQDVVFWFQTQTNQTQGEKDKVKSAKFKTHIHSYLLLAFLFLPTSFLLIQHSVFKVTINTSGHKILTISLDERTHMFQNLVKYLKGPSAMILRMFSTMYTGGKEGDIMLGFGIFNSSQNWVCAQEDVSMCTIQHIHMQFHSDKVKCMRMRHFIPYVLV